METLLEDIDTRFVVGGYRDDLAFAEAAFECLEMLGSLGEVHLVRDDEGRFSSQGGIVELELLAQRAEVLGRVAPLAAGHIEDKEEKLAADDVTKEFVAQADIEVRALDQAGNIRNSGAVVAGKFHDAHDGMEGGEGIGSDLWMGGGDAAEEGGFTGIGIADEAGIRDGAQLEDVIPFLARLARRGLTGDAIGGALKVDVAFAAVAAFAEGEFLPGLREVRDELQVGAVDIDAARDRGLGLWCFLFQIVEGHAAAHGLAGGEGRAVDAINEGAHGHAHVLRLCASAVEILAEAVAAIGAADDRLVEEGGEVVRVGIGAEDDVAAPAPIAAVGTALGDEFLAEEGDAAVSTFAGLGVYFDLIYEHFYLSAD